MSAVPRAGGLRAAVLPGAVAGVAGGLVFGAAMAMLGTLPTVASIVRADSPYTGFAVHLVIAVVLGIGFAALVSRQRARAGELLFWGLAYGAFWWFLGPQTLLPLLRGLPVAWDLAGARALVPSLIGHLCYGTAVALVLVLLSGSRDRVRSGLRPTVLLRGAAAGLLAGSVVGGLGVMAGASPGPLPLAGLPLGLGYPLLFSAEREGAGPAIVRGAAYGFLCWIAAELTLPPLLRDGVLDWSHTAAAAAAGRLPGYILLGALTSALFTLLGALAAGLFTDDVRLARTEAPGARGLRATGHGILAGLAGGLVFTGVMVAAGALPTVARLVGGQSAAVGLLVHLVIAQIVGVSYAVLFRRRGFDLASGLGWGVSYGFVWWVLGGLTLLPVLLGGEPRWSAAGMAAAFPRWWATWRTGRRSAWSTTRWRPARTRGGSRGTRRRRRGWPPGRSRPSAPPRPCGPSPRSWR
ncbi:hypothetical protein [Thermocatellispora tengchongensis]|uniref:hypothetical protein n=1 Tax=Thermocatellispora tengchongensis TaxID=1073253 RepID=UPI00363A7210